MGDLTYYTQRAREERERAAASADPAVASVHAELAERYEALIDATAQDVPTGD